MKLSTFNTLSWTFLGKQNKGYESEMFFFFKKKRKPAKFFIRSIQIIWMVTIYCVPPRVRHCTKWLIFIILLKCYKELPVYKMSVYRNPASSFSNLLGKKFLFFTLAIFIYLHDSICFILWTSLYCLISSWEWMLCLIMNKVRKH